MGYSTIHIIFLIHFFLGLLEHTNILFLYLFSWATTQAQSFYLTPFTLGCSIIPVFRWFLKNVPCSLLSGSMPWLFSPTSASPLGFVRSSLFLFLYFLFSYSSSYYHLTQNNLRDHRDEKGAKWDSKRKKEKNQEKWKESPYILLCLKGKRKESIEK